MVQTKTKLTNYFYFVENCVIFNISSTNDADECGQQVVKDTDAENEAIFPCVKVSYSYQEDGTTKTGVKYYWLQNLIHDGDIVTVDGEGNITKFVKMHDGADGIAYTKAFVDSINKDIENYVSNGYSIEEIKKIMPYYCFISNVGKEVKINNKPVEVSSIEFMTGGVADTDNGPISDEDIWAQIYGVLNHKVYKYTNSLLSVHGKQLTDTEEDFELINADSIQDIPSE